MSNELNIMEEIHKNGPVVLNFEPTFDFMFYVGGVFHSTTPEWIINGMAKPEWV
jgi:cathepsin C